MAKKAEVVGAAAGAFFGVMLILAKEVLAPAAGVYFLGYVTSEIRDVNDSEAWDYAAVATGMLALSACLIKYTDSAMRSEASRDYEPGFLFSLRTGLKNPVGAVDAALSDGGHPRLYISPNAPRRTASAASGADQ